MVKRAVAIPRVNRLKLFFDNRDDKVLEQRGMPLLYWLDDLGAQPVDQATVEDDGFLFAGARPIADYRRLVSGRPRLRDRPEERSPLLRLDSVLESLAIAGVDLPMPRTWHLAVGDPLPESLAFPLFVRTATSSWKLGGRISRVTNPTELEEEALALRRVFGWDAVVCAREWLDLVKAGEATFGPVPQEIRIWVVDGLPMAWSFHYLNVIPKPRGFPPKAEDIDYLARLAERIGSAFRSRCVVADFAKLVGGGWSFLEAGPGSCAGTAHEAVFKAAAARLQGVRRPLAADEVGGPILH
jgi:ATP-grasp domain, R2K clade family 3